MERNITIHARCNYAGNPIYARRRNVVFPYNIRPFHTEESVPNESSVLSRPPAELRHLAAHGRPTSHHAPDGGYEDFLVSSGPVTSTSYPDLSWDRTHQTRNLRISPSPET